MRKADLIEIVAQGTGLTKIETEVVIEGFFKSVIAALKSGEGIEIRGFGSFKVKKKNARNARNPITGAQVQIQEHFVPVFKFSKDFKNAVAEGMKDKLQDQA
ncbi:MAG: integration host factor subunit beta [Ignavibacteriaceae bacterium]|nr:integration host factor subunit beta [Ignavibacteriaceae bacterium]